jgi:hypothetical protein
MVVSGNFANFRSVYDELTQEVLRSNVQFLTDHLANWFRTLDTTSEVAPIIQNLQSGIDFEPWKKELEVSIKLNRGLTWPKEPEKRLATQLLLFRSAAEGGNGEVIAGYGWSFIPSRDTSINNSARRFIDQVFRPMAAELRRYLERQMTTVPAADRVVPLDHNSPSYREVVDDLERLENALRSSNEYSDETEKGQRIAEVSAARRLLDAAQVRVEALVALLRPVIVQFTTKVKDNLITAAALAVSGGIIAWLGHIF